MNKKQITSLSIGLFGIACGLTIAHLPNAFAMANADEATVISAGYCSTVSSANKENLKFEMLYNSAPTTKYQPLRNDCVTLKRDGRVIKISTDNSVDIISKTDATTYVLETSALGEYTPQAGDIYTIKGQFVSHDAGDVYTGKYILDISESSFVVSESVSRSYFVALPQQCVDGGQATMPPEPDQQWHFLFNLYDLEQEDAPVTGDDYAYYPTSTQDVFIDGQPVVNMNQEVLRRRDNWGYMFYVSSQLGLQNWDSLISVGSLIVFDGTFIYKGNKTLPQNKSIGFSLHEVAFHKIGTKVNDYEVVNFRKYLYDTINNTYDAGNYSGATKTEVARILADLENDLSEPETAAGVYKIYNEILTRLAGYQIDADVAAEYLNQLKANAIAELQEYPDFDNYFPNEQAIIRGYISTFITEVQTMTNKLQIVNLLNQTKNKINGVKVRKTVMKESVLNCLTGYEQYLCAYDVVSLNDLNLPNLTFHGTLLERKNDDINTNSQEPNQFNLFTPSPENEKGNVAFKFKYRPNAVPVNGANVMITLRGMPYKGYRFAIDTNTRGCYMVAISQDKDIWIGGNSYYFVNDITYDVEVGAIDLIEYNLTWMYIKINGEVTYDAVIDSLNICVNPRVCLSPNDNFDTNNDYPGTVVVSNYAMDSSSYSSAYCSNPQLSEETVSDNKTIYCSSLENKVPYSEEVSYEFYPLSPDALTITRGLVTTNVGNVSEPLIAKASPNEYQIDISNLELQDGDILTISGQFSYFDNETKKKESFIFGKTTLTYNATTKEWSQSATLDDCKEDAKLQLEYFVDLNDYDDNIALAISGTISIAKKNIDKCSSEAEVSTILTETKAKILRFKTSIDTIKDSATKEVKEYKSDQINEYRQEERIEIKVLKDEAVANITNVLTKEEVIAIVDEFKQNVDALKTDAQYDKEELDEARRNGIQSVQNHYASLNLNSYSSQKREQINQDTIKAIQDLKSASSIEEIESIVHEYISKHPTNQLDGGTIAIIAISSTVGASGLGVLAYFLIKRRRKIV